MKGNNSPSVISYGCLIIVNHLGICKGLLDYLTCL